MIYILICLLLSNDYAIQLNSVKLDLNKHCYVAWVSVFHEKNYLQMLGKNKYKSTHTISGGRKLIVLIK